MRFRHTLFTSVLCGTLSILAQASAGVTADQAAKLKTTLTPFGAEKAGNAAGTIPAWDGGYTTPEPGYVNGAAPADPFASEKPLFSITAANMAQYADKLSDGTKALFAKYPDRYRMDIYPTHRTAAAPQWVYDNTFANATRATLADTSSGPAPQGAYGGIPFPIPANGTEAMWNHILCWKLSSFQQQPHGYLLTADGKRVLTVTATLDMEIPYYFQDGSAATFDGNYILLRLINSGPPIRAGEAITSRENVNFDQSKTWVYLAGQRRTRMLPNACCDTPTPATAGVMSFDELFVWYGRLDRFNWTLAGKKEMYVPYSENGSLKLSDDQIISGNLINPDHVRWELHRVNIVDGALAPGKRHVSPKVRVYLDEDSWMGLLGDRYDTTGDLWKMTYQFPMNYPSVPAMLTGPFGFYELKSGAGYINAMMNQQAVTIMTMPRYPDITFTPDAMAGDSVR